VYDVVSWQETLKNVHELRQSQGRVLDNRDDEVRWLDCSNYLHATHSALATAVLYEDGWRPPAICMHFSLAVHQPRARLAPSACQVEQVFVSAYISAAVAHHHQQAACLCA
jgi:hypothetical protein